MYFTVCVITAARELLEADTGGRGGGGGGGRGFDVSKSGDTRVGFVGFPSVGKSTLLTKLTGTHSEAAAYEASPRSADVIILTPFFGWGVMYFSLM